MLLILIYPIMIYFSPLGDLNQNLYGYSTYFLLDNCRISCEIAFRWLSLDITADKSALLQVIPWCRGAIRHYLKLCWPRSMCHMALGRNELMNLLLHAAGYITGVTTLAWTRQKSPVQWCCRKEIWQTAETDWNHTEPVRVKYKQPVCSQNNKKSLFSDGLMKWMIITEQ